MANVVFLKFSIMVHQFFGWWFYIKTFFKPFTWSAPMRHHVTTSVNAGGFARRNSHVVTGAVLLRLRKLGGDARRPLPRFFYYLQGQAA